MLFVHLSLLLQVSSVLGNNVNISTRQDRSKECTVTPLGLKQDDTPNILTAFTECSGGGTIIFPKDSNYWIATRLNPVVHNITINWLGIWRLSDNLTYWRTSSYPIAFQNHRAAFILSGSSITINARSIGGIHGNGDTWYNEEKRRTREGRPMPFVLWNATDVTVRGFSVWQPPLWAVNLMGVKDAVFDGLYVNATAGRSPWGENWVQNTDGFDTMDAHNITLTNFTYQGGDDCIAIKPRSYNINVRNMTCRGGNGIAIGSLGQYLEDSSVENVTISDVKVIRYNEDLHNSAYIKTWIGIPTPQNNYESAYQPRGGGWGRVNNITFRNFELFGADNGPSITQDNGLTRDSSLTQDIGGRGSLAGTSKMEISNIVFENFTGYLNGKERTSSISCAKVRPCWGIEFKNVRVRPSKEDDGFGVGKCSGVQAGAVKGVSGPGCLTQGG